jgi:hypothetical protein
MLIQSIGCCCRVMKTSNGDTVSLASFEGEIEWHVVLVPLQIPSLHVTGCCGCCVSCSCRNATLVWHEMWRVHDMSSCGGSLCVV